MNEGNPPPVAKYELTLKIRGNDLDKIERELLMQTRGGFLLDSDHYQRDEWHSTDGTTTSIMRCTNPEQTEENYRRELDEWFERSRAARMTPPTPPADAARTATTQGPA